ncbi:hypothetical protein P5V15_009118 [Pogonomyrmex californicus]
MVTTITYIRHSLESYDHTIFARQESPEANEASEAFLFFHENDRTVSWMTTSRMKGVANCLMEEKPLLRNQKKKYEFSTISMCKKISSIYFKLYTYMYRVEE